MTASLSASSPPFTPSSAAVREHPQQLFDLLESLLSHEGPVVGLIILANGPPGGVGRWAAGAGEAGSGALRRRRECSCEAFTEGGTGDGSESLHSGSPSRGESLAKEVRTQPLEDDPIPSQVGDQRDGLMGLRVGHVQPEALHPRPAEYQVARV